MALFEARESEESKAKKAVMQKYFQKEKLTEEELDLLAATGDVRTILRSILGYLNK